MLTWTSFENVAVSELVAARRDSAALVAASVGAGVAVAVRSSFVFVVGSAASAVTRLSPC